MAKKSNRHSGRKFKIGDKVRVKHGFMDGDYPDMPIGGWSGTVKDVQGSDTFTVGWSIDRLTTKRTRNLRHNVPCQEAAAQLVPSTSSGQKPV